MKKNVRTNFLIFLLCISFPLILYYNNSYRDIHLESFPSIKSSQWVNEITLDVGNHPVSIFCGDVNNDGKNDIVAANQADNSISILLWNSTFFDWDSEITKEVGLSPESVSVGDVNNDGLNDIAVSSLDNVVTLFLWNITSKNWDKLIKTVRDDPESVVIGDANNDGYNDIVTANMGDYDISILVWNASIENWNPQIRKHTGYVPYSVYLGDVNNDGYNDIITANYGIDNNISIFLWNSTSNNWDDRMTRYAGNFPYCVFIEDANNNGVNDIAVSSLDGNVIVLCWNDTTNDWNSPIIRTVGFNPRSIFIGDVNNDNYNDIVTANYNDDNISILLWNNIIGDWDAEITYLVGNKPHSVFIEDANYDGKNDILTANYDDNSVSVLLGNSYQLDVPDLELIFPNPDIDGFINLNWSDVNEADNYLVYRNEYYISSTFGLTPIAVVNESEYIDTIYLNGVYYYVVIAVNSTATSSISNCESIVVSIPLAIPILNPIFPNISITGKINLNWSDILGAKGYYVYRDVSNITNSEEASLIAQTIYSNFTDTINTDGIYYYIIIAGDYSSNTSISNCVQVTVKIQSGNSISAYHNFNIVVILVIFIAVVIIKFKDKLKLNSL